MNRRSEGGDDDAPFGFCEDFLKGRNDCALRRRSAGHGRVRRIRKERKHAFLPVASERSQVNRLAYDGRLVNLVIARVNDCADGRANRQREATHQRMRRAYELDCERAKLYDLARLDSVQQNIAEQIVLFELSFRQTYRE